MIEGADNTGATARTGIFTTNNREWAVLADAGQSGSGSLGVHGFGQATVVIGQAAASSATGAGVFGFGAGNGTGVSGYWPSRATA